MKAFNEKCDTVLQFLNNNQRSRWGSFVENTNVKQNDGIISFLKNHKGFIDYDNNWIEITPKGKDFIGTTSFAKQRDNFYSE